MDTKALRQKILDLAIRGKLVPQDPNDEPASVLLERIRQQKQQMVKEGKLKPKDIKNDSFIFVGEDNLHYEKFADGSVKCIEDEIPFDIPGSWAWARTKTVSVDLPYGTSKKSNSSGKVAVLRMGNLQDGEIDYSDLVYSSDEEDIEKYYLLENDLLFNRTNSAEWVGKTSIYRGDTPAIYAGYLIRIRTPLCGEYLNAVMNSVYAKNYCIRVKTDAVNQSNINAQKLGTFLVPVAPIKEQHRIVTSFKRTFEFTQCIQSGKKELSALIQSAKAKILDLAIRGQLVPQDPADEPASVLLDRIRTEKEELIRQGKIKRDKKESVIFRGEDNSYYEKIGEKVSEYDADELPYGWSVGSFSQVNIFTSETINPSNSPDEMFELYSVPNFEAGVPEIIRGKEIGSSKQYVCEKDVLVCKINPRINRVWITGHITPYRLLGSSEWIVFRNHLLFAPYLRYYFSSPHFREFMLSNVSGVGGSLMRAQPESVKKYPVLIPPYQEQIRIAERIDELFALLVAIEKSLN